MLRTLDRVRPWNISGHVCHSCRLKLNAAQRRRVRRQSTSSPSQASDAKDSRVGIPFMLAEDGEDSWLSNYNNLSETRPKPEKKEEVIQADHTEKGEEIKAQEPEKLDGSQDARKPGKSLSPSSDSSKREEKQQKRSRLSQAPGRAEYNAARVHRRVLQRVGSKSHNSDGPYGVRHLRLPVQRRSAKRGSGKQRKDVQVVRALLGQGQIEDAARAELKRFVEETKKAVAGQEEGNSNAEETAEESVAGEDTANKSKGRRRSSKNTDSSTRPSKPDNIFTRLLLGQKGSKNLDGKQNGSGSSLNSANTVRNPSSMYMKMLSGSGGAVSLGDDPTTERRPTETATSGIEDTAFGVNTGESTLPGEFPKQKIVSLSSPGFGNSGDASAATSALTKLHDGGWNLDAAPADESKTTSVKGKKSKASPVTTKKAKMEAAKATEAAKDEAKADKAEKAKLKRRERMKLGAAAKKGASKRSTEDTATSEAPTKKKSSKSKAQTEASPTALPPGSPEPNVNEIEPSALHITPLDIPQPPVPGLEYGLDRVLFNAGVYQLQDPHSRVFNFDPYLQKIMPVVEFEYNALKQYKTSSQDFALAELAKEHNKRYIGSTSSMTGTLGHFHYLLSAWRPLNLEMLSRGFPEKLDTFTQINRAPNAIFLRWKNGTYAIDADKEHDGANVLMMLGKSMEKLLTLPTEDFEKYRKSDPREISEEERSEPEAFQYTTMGDFLMRSQLDAYDPRLPGTGMFDLKTRAVVTIRHSTEDFERMTGYQIHTLQGRFESYEREYYDMMRSTMLKYMLQVRMGRMEGIFIAYHNVERIFGFQYVSLQEMDRALHGQIDRCLGDQEFKASLEMLNKVFDMATAKFPGRSLRFHFETTQEKLASGSTTPMMWIFAEPMEEGEIERIQDASKSKIAEFERTMMGMDGGEGGKEGGVESSDASAREAVSQESTENETPPTESQKEAEAKDTTSTTQPIKSTAQATTSTTTDDDTIAPLFIANILFDSTVNNTIVDRPERLTPKHSWKISYLVQERPADATMWARYADVKTKRREIFEKAREEKEEDGDSEATDGAAAKKARKANNYREFLGSMSEQGRKFRKEVDREEEGRVPVVVGRPVVGPDGAPVGDGGVDGVEGYMNWLYRKE